MQKCLGYNVDKLYRNLVNSNDNDITLFVKQFFPFYHQVRYNIDYTIYNIDNSQNWNVN